MPAICAMESRYTYPTATDTPYMALMPHSNTSCTHRRRWHYLPSLLVLAGITYLSLIKDVPAFVPQNIPLADKWGHMLAYLVLGACTAADSYRAHLPARVIYLAALLLSVAYGGLIELIQPYFPPRQGEWMDWLADCIGAGMGILIFAAWHYLHKCHKCSSSPNNA